MSEKTRVASITVSKLYNLGNYENVKYEVSVEVGMNDRAVDVLIELRRVVDCLKPLKKPHRYDYYKNLISEYPQKLSETEKSEIEEARQIVGDYETAKARRWETLQKLDSLGGSSQTKDHKEDWDRDYDYDEE